MNSILEQNNKDDEKIVSEKLKSEKKNIYFNKNKNSDNNPEGSKCVICIKENEKLAKKKKLCGRKRTRVKESTYIHDKYSDDIIRRKCKYLLIKNLFVFLNNRISFVYDGNIGNSIFKKELKFISQNQI